MLLKLKSAVSQKDDYTNKLEFLVDVTKKHQFTVQTVKIKTGTVCSAGRSNGVRWLS